MCTQIRFMVVSTRGRQSSSARQAHHPRNIPDFSSALVRIATIVAGNMSQRSKCPFSHFPLYHRHVPKGDTDAVSVSRALRSRETPRPPPSSPGSGTPGGFEKTRPGWKDDGFGNSFYLVVPTPTFPFGGCAGRLGPAWVSPCSSPQ